ncbi:DUF3347 domain-containing protein [Gramella sp. BOM4]|jgi:hypothetical protein|uniref:Putative Co/Zn/Cd efflux system membrane fusion protein n=1 Tax=Christiangramia flava JLT2011 TaxID=1229726 RepID=A0A1L7I841_9FLAO|nr:MULTISPECIES: DUF3347 domain-containing protein [Christiangramia]APU69781.1 putative Co/Zn/Cd efflux system membrane fusion protein [Christiangramia flava JLT2011]MUP47050.1 DUF3347 domain-containing protein [Christiangramia bathymodioli]OSS39186.1 Co/Zn/Cd efflux system membrane fusion protein [Christiangramia flava JLT2011]|tara:strand:+ start:71 stop:616 length:546 start_codon:yes stop_codon:yes gene_type:complete
MRSIIKLGIAPLLVLLLASCVDKKETQSVEVNTPQEVKKNEEKTADVADQDFIDGMTGKIWHNYLEIKMALTNDDSGQAKDAAKSMVDSFSEDRAELKSIAAQLGDTDDIEEQRRLFSKFTELAGPMFEEALSGGTIYKKFCPMAFNNDGAYWYADVEEIKNPYFGDKMLNCGSVKKTIEK